MKKLAIALGFVALAGVWTGATIINIPDDFPTIQEGIDHGTDGDTVLVQPGTYYENINFNGHNVILASLFLTTRDTAYISRTVIDGRSAGSVIVFENDEDRGAQVVGFTIQHGFAECGGGIRCSATSPTISSNNISGNWVSGENAGGSGVGCYYGDPVVRNNRITRDSVHAYDGLGCGAGIDCWSSGAEISGNVISGNFIRSVCGTNAGGGICCFYSNPTISSNLIMHNSSWNFGWGGDGGGIYCRQSNLTMSNNVLSCNFGDHGGGIAFVSSESNMTNNTFTGNCGYYDGAAIYCSDSYIMVTNSILWQDSAWWTDTEIYIDGGAVTVTYSDVRGGWPGGGNIDVDPLFRGAEAGDFHLMAGYCGDPYDSPCIDAGHPDSLDQLLDCFHGLCSETSDMGAYGGRNLGWPTPVEDDRHNQEQVPRHFVLAQNYPNPFNAATAISYVVPVPSNVKLEVYNLLGERVATLVEGKQQPTDGSVTWDASGFSSGLYFYRLTAGEFSQTRRMILVK
jgi:hypothetical protein